MGCSGSDSKKSNLKNQDLLRRMGSLPEFRVVVAKDKNGKFDFI
jgi:hypothetical protein